MQDIIDAGGVLERDIRGDHRNYRTMVGAINRRQMAPDGQQVIMIERVKPFRIRLRLSAVSEWRTKPPADIVSAQRNPRWHPVVAALHSDDWLSSIDAALRQRAFRLLHALASEAEARGHTVRKPKLKHRGHIAEPGCLGGCLIVTIEPISCSLAIAQKQDAVPRPSTRTELEKSTRESSQPRIPPRVDVSSHRLTTTLDTSSRFSSKVAWSDTNTRSLEARLPDVLTTFERWALVDAESTEAARLVEIEAQKRHEHEDELAREAYAQQALADQLMARLEAWEHAGRLRNYLAAMAEQIEHIADDDERSAAIKWLEWCEHYTTEQDPLNKPIRTPTVRPPGYSDIAQFRKRLGFGTRLW
ncbi:uncharacterized protein RMCN_1195 [Mycolicibacterium novocastrense]|uniref:Uncharacterized protein n=1 Tax=Mycolicibacterium novocastrense TaxID=59813 RepID=A0ABQ0KF94_MYCNV|nr:hypothetical protein [Mycolicibacterium novocastrense]GAT08062.1 uncharacterized protein RMCN_1195 [Mycolicibacterium novocastrense]